MVKMTTMGVKLDEDTRNRLKTLGEHRERSPHWLMKKAINEFLDKEEELEQRNREADDAWSEYQTTGQSVSHETMDAWLETWGTDKESPCPKLSN
jgi:predicted transcriptional regulator